MEINEQTASQEATNDAANTDNSTEQDFTQEDIMSALKEPEEDGSKAEKATEVNDDNSVEDTPPSQDNKQDNPLECPDKFKNEDGTANWDKVLKSYKELEPLVNQKAQWEKERAELLSYKQQIEEQQKQYEQTARQQGFNSTQDMEHSYELAALKANEYYKHIRETEEPEKVTQMLIDYANNPNDELLSEIEFEFPSNTIKEVTRLEEQQKQYYNYVASKQAETQKMSNIEGIIGHAVEKHDELFDYAPFKQLFVNALNKYGDRFTNEDAEALMNTMVEMKKLFQEEFTKQSTKDAQNKQATDNIASLNNKNSAPAASQKELDISKMTDKQLAKYLQDFV